MATNDFDPEDDEDQKSKAAAIIMRPVVPLPRPRPMVSPDLPLEPEAPTFAKRYEPIEAAQIEAHHQHVMEGALDPTSAEIAHEKHFDPNLEAWRDVEDRRNEDWMRTKMGALPASSLQEWGYRQHPEMRPRPAISTPSTGEPSTPMARALGRNDINLLHHAKILHYLLDLLGAK